MVVKNGLYDVITELKVWQVEKIDYKMVREISTPSRCWLQEDKKLIRSIESLDPRNTNEKEDVPYEENKSKR